VVQLSRRLWASDICAGDISAASIAALAEVRHGTAGFCDF
jgi:hypothetical protein